MSDAFSRERVRLLRRYAREARNTYVGRHWPSMEDMRRDGMGYALVEDNKHEAFIRRFIATFEPEFVMDLLAEIDRLRADTGEPAPTPAPETNLGRIVK